MNYSVQLIDLEENSLIQISQFLNNTFPKNKKFTLDFVRWQYTQNPLGKMVGFNAWDQGRIISHFSGLPIKMNLFGHEKKGLLCINVGTNANYRGKKLFAELGNRIIEYAKQNGFDFMIAVPNANSTHAFLKHFDFYIISPLSVKIGFKTKHYPDRDYNCFKLWDTDQWFWRLKNPSNQYAYNRQGYIHSPISFFAKTVSKVKPSTDSPYYRLNESGFRPLNLYIGLGADDSERLYFNFPSFIKRPPFNLVFRDLKENIPTIKKEDIFLQLIDLDTI